MLVVVQILTYFWQSLSCRAAHLRWGAAARLCTTSMSPPNQIINICSNSMHSSSHFSAILQFQGQPHTWSRYYIFHTHRTRLRKGRRKSQDSHVDMHEHTPASHIISNAANGTWTLESVFLPPGEMIFVLAAELIGFIFIDDTTT